MSDTLIDLFEARVNQSGPRIGAWSQVESAWEKVSWNQWWDAAERAAAGLISLGVLPGDRIAILSGTRFEWAVLDIAIAMAGAVSVPIYPSNLPDVVRFILKDSGCRFAFVEDPSQLDKVASVRTRLKDLKKVVYIEPSVAFDKPDWAGRHQVGVDDVKVPRGWAISLENLESLGRRLISSDHAVVIRRRSEVEQEQLATIVYTSGTTKNPKGVELTHKNLVFEVESIMSLHIFDSSDSQVLFLPLAHIFARVLSLAAIGDGFPTAYLNDVRRLSKTLEQIRPTFFAGVPHVFDTIRTKLIQDARRSGGVREALFDAAYLDFPGGESRPWLDRMKHKVFDGLVYQRIKDVFGGRIRFMISGGAPLPHEIAEFYLASDLLVLEGYGLTESTAVATVNLPDEYRFGTVGRPLPGVEVTIAEDGEVLVRGNSVMRGYHNLPEDSAAALDQDGWLHTGDIGEYDRDGFLKVTGRKKDIIVTSGGKNISPQTIETMIAASPFVKHVMVCGEGRPFLSALLILNRPNIQAWAKGESIALDGLLSEVPEVRALMQNHIDAVNTEMANHATVRRFAILEVDFDDAHALTPTNKIRRDVVEHYFRDEIDALYAQSGSQNPW